MQTYGVTKGLWPGAGDLTSTYAGYWGELAGAITNVKLPTGTSKESISPAGDNFATYNILVSAAGAYSSFGAASYGGYGGAAWLGTPTGRGDAYYVLSGGSVVDNPNFHTSTSFVCAPCFSLDLSRCGISTDGTIIYIGKRM